MDDAIRAMINKRTPKDGSAWDRALREVLQEAALAGLWRGGFFGRAAFYGGTALRLFHGLDRFSEDLDFTLIEPDSAWKLADRLDSLRAEIEAFGFSVTVESKHQSEIDSAFIKANTKIHLVRIDAPASLADATAANRIVKVKLEVDTDPPTGIRTAVKTLLEPFPISVRVVAPACLCAGKLHACLCRAWKTRVKGRDWYDLLFFIRMGIPVDLPHLEARLKQSGHWSDSRPLAVGDVQTMLKAKIAVIDWTQAVNDVAPFIRDARALELWSTALFFDAIERLRFE